MCALHLHSKSLSHNNMLTNILLCKTGDKTGEQKSGEGVPMGDGGMRSIQKEEGGRTNNRVV